MQYAVLAVLVYGLFVFARYLVYTIRAIATKNRGIEASVRMLLGTVLVCIFFFVIQLLMIESYRAHGPSSQYDTPLRLLRSGAILAGGRCGWLFATTLCAGLYPDPASEGTRITGIQSKRAA